MEFTDDTLYAWVADPAPETTPEPEHGALGPASAHGAVERAIAEARCHEECYPEPWRAFTAVLRVGGHDGWTVVDGVPPGVPLSCVITALDNDPEVVTFAMIGYQVPDPPLPPFYRHETLHDDVIVGSEVPGLQATWHPEPEPEPKHLRPHRRRRPWSR